MFLLSFGFKIGSLPQTQTYSIHIEFRILTIPVALKRLCIWSNSMILTYTFNLGATSVPGLRTIRAAYWSLFSFHILIYTGLAAKYNMKNITCRNKVFVRLSMTAGWHWFVAYVAAVVFCHFVLIYIHLCTYQTLKVSVRASNHVTLRRSE